MHGSVQINWYEILDLFVVIKYTQGSRNKILYSTRVRHSMSCVQYKYNVKMGNYTHDYYHIKVMSDQTTLSSLG